MANYDFVFSGLGLKDWCNKNGTGGAEPVSMADLMAQSSGKETPPPSLWDLPFPSMDALHKACEAFPKSRALTKGLEQGFLGDP